jgi:hypothetical protein
MNRPKNLGLLLLGIYLVVTGLMGLFGIHLGQINFLIPLLALAAGVCLLLGR